MAIIHELVQRRAELTENIRALMNRVGEEEMGAEDRTALTAMETDFDALNLRINTEQRQLDRERLLGEDPIERMPAPAQARMTEAFGAYLRQGSPESMQIYSAIQMDRPTQAGYLVAPEQFVSELIKELADATFMRKKARVLPPLKGAHSLGYPVRTARMNSFAWGTELQEPNPDVTLAFGKREFKPRPGTSEILVSKTLVRNVDDIDALIRGEIAEEAGEAMEKAYMSGDGANCPLGLFHASPDGIDTDRDVSTGNTATEIKVDGLLEAKFAVKDKYQPGCEWIFHRTAILKLMKLKDSDGQYIWQPSVVQGTPDLLLGRPVNSSEFAPHTFTTGKYVGLYGDLKHYWIVDALGLEIQVLTELYARSNQIDYLSRLETDGAPVMPAAFVRVKLA